MSEEEIKYNEIEDLDYCLKLLEDRDKEIERLHSIIKEVREYSNRIIESDYYTYLEKEKARHFLEILDKVDKE